MEKHGFPRYLRRNKDLMHNFPVYNQDQDAHHPDQIYMQYTDYSHICIRQDMVHTGVV